jgi:REP element-mobilizing transposase RayT
MEIDKDKHIRKSHNKNALLYHIVCPVGYRRKVINEKIAETLKNICVEIGERFEIHFMEIGDDSDHVHFLVQSVSTMTPKNIVQTIKSITARELFKHHPEIRKMLWGGKFWTSGYYINTVGLYAGAESIQNYVKNQGGNYKKHYSAQARLFEGI